MVRVSLKRRVETKVTGPCMAMIGGVVFSQYDGKPMGKFNWESHVMLSDVHLKSITLAPRWSVD